MGPPALAALTAVAVDRATAARGLLPPCFREGPAGARRIEAAVRRALGTLLLAIVLWIGVFGPLATVGLDVTVDLARVTAPQLFLIHGLLMAAVGGWYLLGFVGPGGSRDHLRSLGSQHGFRTTNPWREIALGAVAGLGAWVVVLALVLLVGVLVWALGAEDVLPQRPPEVIPWIIGLPFFVRVLLSLSAGVAEEVFFRGLLQPRVGITLSTACFVLAHLSYDQPFMLIGITALSVIFALLVRWRQNLWPAIAAHAVFDAVQLLVVIPTLLELLPTEF